MSAQQKALLKEYHDAVNSYIQSAWDCSTGRKKNDIKGITDTFKRKGLKIRYGRWHIREKKLLHNNFEHFVRAHEDRIGNPVDFVVVPDDSGRNSEVRRLKKDLDYERCMCEGLFRERSEVRNHTHHTLDPLAVANGQKYEQEELNLLNDMVEKYGRKWKLISKEMNRSSVSVQSAHRNFFLHKGYTRQPPTRKQEKKLIKEMRRHYPDLDLTCELATEVPWNSIANKIGFMHGKYLCSFWESRIKFVDDKGKLRLRKAEKIPVQMIRKFVKHVSKQKPTHLDSLDWSFYYKMFAGYVPGAIMLKAIIPKLLRKYKIDESKVGLAKAVRQLYTYMKRSKRFDFQSIWDEIKYESVKMVRWQSFHWVLSPDLAHFVHESPIMYRGYAEEQSEEVKEEPLDIDEVW